MISYRKALPEEAEMLSNIAIESKGYWGYSREQLDIWRKDLRVEKSYIRENTIKTIWIDAECIGFFAIKVGEENNLDHLWLLPGYIGRGIGKLVFEEIIRICRQIGVHDFVIISDPDAEGFYLHQGAVKTGEVQSIPQNRMLPKLHYTIED